MDPNLSEISQTEKGNYTLFHLYVDSKKKQMNQQNRNRHIDTGNNLLEEGEWENGSYREWRLKGTNYQL